MEIVPYDLYVKYLITRGHLTLKEINDELSKVQLLPVSQAIYNRHLHDVKGTLPQPIWEQVETQKIYGQTFLNWMRRLNVDEAWRTHKAYTSEDTKKVWALVLDIQYDPQVRMAIRCMLMKNVGFEELANAINAKYSTMLNLNHLKIYQKFFWNHAYMKRGDWKEYLSQRRITNSEKNLLFTCLTETEDVVRTKLGLAASIVTSDALQLMATEALLKVKHYLKVDDQTGNREARFWMDKAQSLLALREKYKAADLRDFSKELQMEFEYIETNFDTPDEATLKEVQEKDPSNAEKKDDTEGNDEEQQNLKI